jgi:hypothetical protein
MNNYFLTLAPFLAACPEKLFFKEKTEKKKADKEGGHSVRTKGNGIIGGDPLGRRPFMP